MIDGDYKNETSINVDKRRLRGYTQSTSDEGGNMPAETADRILSIPEAAQLLGLAPNTVRHLARTGQLPGRRVGKQWRFSHRALTEWIRSGGAQSAGAAKVAA